MPDFDAGKLSTVYLKQNSNFRDRFVLLYRLLVVLVGVNQKNVALAAAASRKGTVLVRRMDKTETSGSTEHYAHYFFAVQSAWMAFKREEAMGAMKSLIDTVVMELVRNVWAVGSVSLTTRSIDLPRVGVPSPHSVCCSYRGPRNVT